MSRNLIFAAVLFASTLSAQQIAITTGEYNAYRTGANLNEKILDVSNVNPAQFGKIGSYTVNGTVMAQPLYVSNVHIGKGKPTDVLFVATMHNTIYAFDANQPGSLPLWQHSLGSSVPANRAGICPAPDYTGSEVGTLSTPIIDLNTNTLYAVYATPTGPNTYGHYIAAIDITTGLDKPGSPNRIAASVPGSGYDAAGGQVSLNETTYLQRPALTLANGNVYAAFASCGPDPDPYHGWVAGYSAANVQTQTAVFNTTPNGWRGGIWQAGRGLVVLDSGSLVAETGNGTNSNTDVANSVIKLSAGGVFQGVFTPADFQQLDANDLDLSSTGPLYIPSRGLLIASGKQGIVYVLDQYLNPVQSFQATTACEDGYQPDGCHKVFSTAFWDDSRNPLLYLWGRNDTLRAYRLVNGQFSTVPDSVGPFSSNYPPGILAVSADSNKPNTGVLWAITAGATTTDDGVLHAFDATNVAHEIYSSAANAGRDSFGPAARFAVPTVAGGKVFVPSAGGQVAVYGLLPK